MQPSKRASATQEYYFSSKLREIRAMQKAGKDVINLGIGSPDLAPDIEVINAIAQSMGEANSFKYQPYQGIPELNVAIKTWYEEVYDLSLPQTLEILPLLGSKEGIGFLTLAYLNEGEEALIPNPGYPTYAAAIKLAGGVPVRYDLTAKNNWHPNLEELEKQITPQTKIMFVNYPHMPTGQQADRDKLQALVKFCIRHQILLCNDNPYSHTLSENPFSIFQLSESHSHCIELNSLSKSHSLAGARIGMLLGNKDLLEPVLKIQGSFSSGMFKPLQLGAITALKSGLNAFETRNEIYAQRRQKVWELLDLLKCSYDKSSGGMFVWAQIPQNCKNGHELSEELLHAVHVFITPGFIFGDNGDQYIRVSLCQPEETIIQAIERAQIRTTN
jgi:LL-diaminopimelate aminotransferase